MREKSDPGGQLAYLEAQLNYTAQNKQTTWIIGNMNPGSKFCNAKWSRRYNILIEKYQHVVRMQLFGHEDEEYF